MFACNIFYIGSTYLSCACQQVSAKKYPKFIPVPCCDATISKPCSCSYSPWWTGSGACNCSIAFKINLIDIWVQLSCHKNTVSKYAIWARLRPTRVEVYFRTICLVATGCELWDIWCKTLLLHNLCFQETSCHYRSSLQSCSLEFYKSLSASPFECHTEFQTNDLLRKNFRVRGFVLNINLIHISRYVGIWNDDKLLIYMCCWGIDPYWHKWKLKKFRFEAPHLKKTLIFRVTFVGYFANNDGFELHSREKSSKRSSQGASHTYTIRV